MKLKICGMKYKNNINEIAQLRPDYMGFIFYEKSSRYIDTDIPVLPNSIQKVGVFVLSPISRRDRAGKKGGYRYVEVFMYFEVRFFFAQSVVCQGWCFQFL